MPKFYTFKSKDARERILYANFIQVNKDVKNMINEIFRKRELSKNIFHIGRIQKNEYANRKLIFLSSSVFLYKFDVNN